MYVFLCQMLQSNIIARDELFRASAVHGRASAFSSECCSSGLFKWLWGRYEGAQILLSGPS